MAARRSPRVSTHNVQILERLLQNKDVPPCTGDTLSNYLWMQTTEIRETALNSTFVQGLKNATLNPEGFGAYLVQDAVFCYMAMEDNVVASWRALNPSLKHFLEQRAKSYREYAESLFKTWHIECPIGIKLGGACAAYVNHERKVATSMAPLYFVVAMIPCAKLWPWIGMNIQADASHEFGVYTDWVRENFAPDFSGVAKYEDLINAAERCGLIDRQTALEVYRGSMQGEAGFFNSVTGNSA